MKLTLIRRKTEAPGVESFVFELPPAINWKAGQFFHYVLHHRPTDDRGSDRWFTIAAAPSEKVAMITTRFDGKQKSTFKQALSELKVGEAAMEVSDLDGDFTLEDMSQEYVFIAGGIGITPFRSILKELDTQGQKPKITLLYASRNEHVVYSEDLKSFADHNPNLKLVYIFAPERIDITTIQNTIPNIMKPVFYVSGPEPMVENLGNALKTAGIPAEHIKQDWFPGYLAE